MGNLYVIFLLFLVLDDFLCGIKDVKTYNISSFKATSTLDVGVDAIRPYVINQTIEKDVNGGADFKTITKSKNSLPQDSVVLANKKSNAGSLSWKSNCGKLQIPMNSASVCSNLDTCTVTCNKGFYTQSGLESMAYVCKNKQWVQQISGKAVFESCLPKCEPPCKNGGKCVMPNQCQCANNFYGSSCETEKVSCKSLPPLPSSSSRKCNSETCTISCLLGRVFPDGSSSVDLHCQNGKWISSKEELITIPDCIAVCDPPCVNGGKCIDTNTCFCPQEFRGEFCQYSVDICDASKLNFNGNYNCSGDEERFSCELSCAPGMLPTEKFQSVYTCLYSNGFFTPVEIPQCQSEANVIIKSVNYSSDSTMSFTNASTSTAVSTTCMYWGSQLKTLNDKVISFKSDCIFTLLQDELEHLFQVQVHFKDGIISKIFIYINNVEYILSKNVKGKPSLSVGSTGQQLYIPSQLTDLKIEMVSGNSVALYLPATGLYLIWNLEDELRVDVSAEFWNRTGGLCGRGSSSLAINNLQTYVKNAVVSSLFEKCEEPIKEEKICSTENRAAAQNICSKLSNDVIFESCQKKMPINEYLVACEWSYCNCEKENPIECMCLFFAKFVQLCDQAIPGSKIDWRDQLNCEFKCPADQIYSNCVPVSQTTCTSDKVNPTALQKYCEEGCVCAPGNVLHEGKCIAKDVCPCIFGGNFYEPNSVISKDCNKCTCVGGKWSCTSAICKAECFVFGYTHYRTFDGKKYDFLGKCSYKLVVTDNVTIEAVHADLMCEKSKPSSTKAVIIRVGTKVITLKEFRKVLIDNVEVEQLPTILDDNTYIRKASSFLVQVLLPNGLEIFWNGEHEVQIFANSSLYAKTKGLCGTFNNNQEDDLLTPDGDIERSIVAFANKWRTNEKCEVEKTLVTSDACEVFIQNKPFSETYCSNLTGVVFKDCHAVVDQDEYYEDCLNDMCSCQENSLADCFCPTLSAYAQECARSGVVIDWRSSVRACGIHCPLGQKYEICGASCQRSCADISHGEMCRSSCTEGCYCPTGYTLNEFEECIPINECPCVYKGKKYQAGHIDVKDEEETWECKNAVWEIRKATEIEIEKYRHKVTCMSANMNYVECEPPEPITCRNMHKPPQYSDKTCHSGCVCKEGYVLESVTKQCIEPIDCPCHHGGRSYSEGEKMRADCNNCTCTKGKWECTNVECASVCSTWGDSHFRTFDGRFFDFQGTCDYVFAEGQLSNAERFLVSVEIVPCGTGGISCTKSVTVSVGNDNHSEIIKFDKDRPQNVKTSFKNFEIMWTNMYVMVLIKSLAISLQWDKATRIRLQADPKWKNKLIGLCGNYNGNALDDFQTPSGGLVEVSPSVFADSWKLQLHCPFPSQIQDSCTFHPHRKFWSIKKCSHLKESPTFKQCHSEVPVEEYYKRCVFDACACDQGGDCECLCTSFSAYAQECNAKGVPLKWRRQDLCPIQCEAGTEYNPCVLSCPDKSCSNLHDAKSNDQSCRQVPCVEGCKKQECPPGQIFRNFTSKECISLNSCECMNINGTVYMENDIISEDECHSCFCSKGRKVCAGIPCNLNITDFGIDLNVTTHEIIPTAECKDGWGSWWFTIPKNYEGILERNMKFEEKDAKINCAPANMKDVRCQSKTKNSGWKNIDCYFGKKIQCADECDKFQIQIQCVCFDQVTVPPFSKEVINVEKCSMTCDKLCHHYKYQLSENGRCKPLETCKVNCSGGMYWRDEATCVSKDACLCMSYNGTVVKPGTLIHEKYCSVCQCINNEYICSVPSCPNVTDRSLKPSIHVTEDSYHISVTSEEPEFITTPIYVPLLPLCSPENLIPIDNEAKYNASTSTNGYTPSEARLITSGKTIENKRSWKAGVSNTDQYLEVDLQWVQPVYGVITAGNPDAEDFVKSFKVLYSTDGENYHVVESFGGSELFRGAYDHEIPETQIFKTPVESRYIRLKPITWQNSISMLVQILGCAPVTYATPPPTAVCLEPMGIESGAIRSSQITVASSLNENFTAADLSLTSSVGWAPFIASTDQYIQVDFLDDRIIDGITTKGSYIAGSLGESWTEAFKVKYSSDGVNWNSIVDEDKSEKVFPANFDNFRAYSNFFDTSIRARYIRLYPVKWNNFPTLRLEILGCFIPSDIDEVPSPTPSPTQPVVNMNVCHDIVVDIKKIPCSNGTYWNGKDCVQKEFCPCVEGLLTYQVGSSYLKNQCDKCICSLSGIPSCHAAAEECPPCGDSNLLRVVNDNCTCGCLPCPLGTLLCPTSNICLNESLWCNGYNECPDDENSCGITTKTVDIVTESYTNVTTPRVPKQIMCPEPSCPDSYSASFIESSSRPTKSSILDRVNNNKILKTIPFNETVHIKSTTEYKWGNETIMTNVQKVHSTIKSENITSYINMEKTQSVGIDAVVCQDWSCVPNDGVKCTKPICPAGTKLTTKWTGKTCPVYECIVLPPTEKECNVNGRLISTFDGLSYKYDVCDHILAEDKMYGTWKVRKLNKCPFVGNCISSLIIVHNHDVIELFANFTASYNGYKYTVPQLQAIGNKNELFVIQSVSTKFIIFASTDLKFSVVWSTTGTVKIVVESSLRGMIDGLCGFFDFNVKNDKSIPDGSVVISTQEFGDSWKYGNDTCKAKVCPKDVQTRAKEICEVFKKDPFSTCDFTMNVEEHIAKCIESLCTCGTSEVVDFDKECRCPVIQNFAATCLSSQPGVDLSLWRMKYDCPVNCTSPLVYHECYDRICEPGCDSLLQKEPCPRAENRCFPGCYCPEGLIRKGDTCIKPAECRDCVCSGNSVAQMTTFDHVQITFDGTCSSNVLLQTKNTEDNDANLKIILTHAQCINAYFNNMVCPRGITVIVHKKEILLFQSEEGPHSVSVTVDNNKINNFPYADGLIEITERPGISITLSVPSLQLDATLLSNNKGFSLQLPSYLYSEKLEGLCGTCNRNQTDDIIKKSGKVAETFEDFLSSWSVENPTGTKNWQCKPKVSKVINETVCDSPPENNPCTLLLNKELFGQCHPIVNPVFYVEKCQQLLCEGINYCQILSSYALECQGVGICVPWRSANVCPYKCPAGFEYEACGFGCEINCDNFEQYQKGVLACSQSVSERCVCPEGQVILNGSCIEEVQCRPCDEFNHYVGDKWMPDNCTTCECSKDGSLGCLKKECPAETICPMGMKAIIDNNNDDSCCLKHICVSEAPTEHCSPPVKITCGKDQIIKLDTSADNCTQYICVCILQEECPKLDLEQSVELLPGMIQRVKKEGCCPSVDLVCDVNTCPAPVECPQFHERKLNEKVQSCCPSYMCVLPPGSCIYEYQWIADTNGSERKRLSTEMYTELKQVDDTWYDGPCRSCMCMNETSRAICQSIKCAEAPERDNFVVKPFYTFGDCCPTYKLVACKMNGIVYEVNSTWSVQDEPCKTISCVQNAETGEISLKEVIKSCHKQCEPGWTYVETENRTSECCGSCKQEACVDGAGILRNRSSKWYSDDKCVTFECDDELHIMGFSKTCPNIFGCPEEFIHFDGCCKSCNVSISSQLNCGPVSMPLNDTVGLISKRVTKHGNCINKEEIKGFTKCDGVCNSFAFYDERTFKYSHICKCCVGTDYKSKNIKLICDDGYKLDEKVEIPSSCECQSCGDTPHFLKSTTTKKPLSILPFS